MVMKQYRAVCPEHHFKGPWRETYNDALGDANDYMVANPTRIVKIEFRTYID